VVWWYDDHIDYCPLHYIEQADFVNIVKKGSCFSPKNLAPSDFPGCSDWELFPMQRHPNNAAFLVFNALAR
jgi:hypothetical protein